jgi:hypothetical protein
MTEESKRFTARRLFEELDGRRFDRFSELQSAVRDLFTEHLADFPVGYDYWDAITLAEQRGWLAPDDSGVRVRVDKVTA